MTTLSYATPPKRRWSRMALASFIIALLHIPFFIAIYQALDQFHVLGYEGMLQIVPAALFLPSFVAASLGIASVARSLSSKGVLRGWPLGILATVISVWPVALILLVITSYRCC